jgi:uncharacterized protein YjiS (DUF1127 family)
MSTVHAARYQSSSMSLVRDAATPTPCSHNASSTVSMASTRGTASEALVDHAAERNRSRLRRVWQVIGLWLRRRKDRAILRSLSPHDIGDFCPKYTEAHVEMNKPFWRP